MRRRGISLVGVAFAVLIALVLVFMLRLTAHRPPAVVLPETGSAQSEGGVIRDEGRSAIRRVEVTPETVQRVIERLARPDNYSRTVTIERYWSGGSGLTNAAVFAVGGWTRVDVTESGGETRHVITGDGKSWIWYGADERVFTGAAALSADEEQSIPTYEEILLLDMERIAAADYRTLDGVNCIYVETAPDDSGYVDRYWVSVDSGLLVAAERDNGNRTIYRMVGLEVEIGGADEREFRLPDGEILFRPLEEAGN